MIIRKRNKKLENDTEYEVVYEDQIDFEFLETFKQNIASGMEAEEEKEQHLRTVIMEGQGEIPIPIVTKVSGISRPTFKIPNELIQNVQDCKNTMILNSQDRMYLEKNRIDLEEIANSQLCDVEDEKKRNFLMKRSLRLINTDEIIDSYICFRKRILKSSKKSRRSESNVNERIKRIWKEFNILKKIYELHFERVELEEELLVLNMQIVQIGMESESMRHKAARRFKKKRRDLKVDFYKGCGPFSELRQNSFKIKVLKDLISKKDPNVSQDELEREVKAYENYKEMHGDE